MRRYLESKSPLITEEARERARAFLEAAEQLTVGLVVTSSVPEAEVSVDGEYLGRTPLGVVPADVRIDPGRHELVVKKTGFVEFRETLTVMGSANHNVRAELKPIVHEGRLIVRAKPGNLIQVDGARVGYGNFDAPLASGTHTLRVSAPEAQPFETKLVVADNRTHTFQINLEPLPKDWGIPTWAWIGGASVLAVGAGVAGYFLLKPEEPKQTEGTLDTL
jgi:diacylglycerol kinase family enzyme